ncbi:MAG TPA: choice-of-anchor tandem repeat GloVer-containing protein [Parafilimonas sp.]|nr:choice-of-anchor tandem repeat GloVer-containing protein [Parafilimonas sp.]
MRKVITLFIPVRDSMGIIFFLLSMTIVTSAQDILTGLTSNGGPEGGGTAFSIKSNGTGFSIIKGFADWGRMPEGDLYPHTDGNFYGMTHWGGIYDHGTLFKITSSGAITIIKNFNYYDNDGAYPYGELIKGPDGNMWGMTSSGGINTTGVVFKLTTDGVFTVVHQFDYNKEGSAPHGHLVLGKDGNFYGITASGGTYGYGTIFKMTPSGTCTVLRALNGGSDGGPSYGSITEGTDGNLYGMTYGGGTNNIGTIIKISKTGSGFTVLRSFTYGTDGGYTRGDLIQATDGFLYGMTAAGAVNGYGAIFKIKTTGASFSVIRNLSGADGTGPNGSLMQHTDGFLYGLAYGSGAHGGGTFFKISTAGVFTRLYSFTPDTDGGNPEGGVIAGTDGDLYGLTTDGGPNFGGTAFKVTTAGAFTLLAGFNGATLGNTPYESLVRGNDIALYGTTSNGGTKQYYGTIFKICAGNTTVLHSFDATGGNPKGSLVQANNGIFYGTTEIGGTNNAGVIFKITKSGTYTVLKNLAGATDGDSPNGSLIQATDGNLYGMNYSGGMNSGGTIFKITLSGTLTVLRHLASADGYYPYGALVQGTDGNFYGCTSTGGANGGGTIFKITPAGTFTVLRNLANGDGTNPQCNLVQHSNGNFYGTTTQGGNNGGGTIFRITSAGSFQVLKHLATATNGGAPKGSLLVGTDGSLYGMTSDGGTYDAGTIFKITTTGTYTVLRHLNLVTDGGVPYGGLIIMPPNTLVANAQSVTTNEDTKKNITLTGSGSPSLSCNVLTNPKHGTVTGTGANRAYKPAKNFNGKDSFTFNVIVGCITSSPATIKITVTAVADTPVLTPIGNKTVKKDSTLQFTAKAKDGDKGETITYSLIGAPAGTGINASTGVFKWTPHSTGSFTFKVRATDNSALLLYDEETIKVTVTAAFAANNPEAMEVAIRPNPASNKLTVTLSKPVDKAAAIVTDAKGFELIRSEFGVSGQRLEINVERLKPGVYFLRLQTNESERILPFIKKE